MLDQTWEIPREGFFKINVHYVAAPHPLANGNINGVGVIVRNRAGDDIWKATGPMNTLNEEQALMAGIQSACIEAQKRTWDHTHIETTNFQIYETVRAQEHFILEDHQLEAYSLFNTVYANHFEEGSTDRRISCIPAQMNSTAAYLAEYGMNNLTEFAEAQGLFGDLKYHLDRDMGMVIAAPVHEVMPNFGLGEVIDGPPPKSTLKRKCPDYDVAVVKLADSIINQLPKDTTLRGEASSSSGSMKLDKGKAKLYHDYAFCKNGVFTPKALQLIENASLVDFAETFGNVVVDLEYPAGRGIHAKDILHQAVKGSLQDIIPMKSDCSSALLKKQNEDHLALMSTAQVLSSMGLNNSESTPKNNHPVKKLRRGASI